MLPFPLCRSRRRREHPARRCSRGRATRKRDACKQPGCGVLPMAHYPKTHKAAHSESQTRAVKAPADRARCSVSHRLRSCAKPLLIRRCPSLPSGNRQSFASPTGDPESRDRLRCVPDTRADLEKLRPKGFLIPSAAAARRFLRRRETAARQVSALRSSAIGL